MIGVDLTYIKRGRDWDGELQHGIQLFVAEILDGFVELGLQDQFCLIVDYELQDFFLRRFPKYRQCVVHWKLGELVWNLSGKRIPLSRVRKRFYRKLYLKAVTKKNFSCVWFPYSTPDSVYLRGERTCLTIHDIIPCHEEHSGELVKRWKTMAESCGNIVVISEYVRKDIAQSFDMDMKGVTVIPNAIKLNMDSISEEPVHDRKYILSINAYAPRKNTITLLKAFEKIKDRTEWDLICCGGYEQQGYRKQLNEYIQEHDLSDRVKLLFLIPADQKNWLLKNASVFVTPSTNEGFGRTPVEAAICGVPVISTKATSLYDATLGLVHYYDEPENEEELANKIMECIQSPDTAEKLEKISQQIQATYSIESCAMKYWEILKKYEMQN